MVRWSEAKNQQLQERRGISFDRIAELYEKEEFEAIVKHETRPNQQILVMKIDGYFWAVPFVIEEDGQTLRRRAMKDIFELDEEEQRIEDEIGQYVPADARTEAKVRRIAQESKKRKNVNIRISERDLSQIRDRASREGIPYQTLIASVLHKYVTDQLYDEREIRKTLELIESSGTK